MNSSVFGWDFLRNAAMFNAGVNAGTHAWGWAVAWIVAAIVAELMHARASEAGR